MTFALIAALSARPVASVLGWLVSDDSVGALQRLLTVILTTWEGDLAKTQHPAALPTDNDPGERLR